MGEAGLGGTEEGRRPPGTGFGGSCLEVGGKKCHQRKGGSPWGMAPHSPTSAELVPCGHPGEVSWLHKRLLQGAREGDSLTADVEGPAWTGAVEDRIRHQLGKVGSLRPDSSLGTCLVARDSPVRASAGSGLGHPECDPRVATWNDERWRD